MSSYMVKDKELLDKLSQARDMLNNHKVPKRTKKEIEFLSKINEFREDKS